MEARELRKKFLKFFEERGHAIVKSSPLIPDDPSVLLTTAGMQQFKSYLTGAADPEKSFGARNVFSIQKCFRTTDIDEIGDSSHLTFFQMMGNFSFGGYFKERAIPLSFEFLTSPEGAGIDPHKIFVTAFKGDDEVPKDSEAIALWQEQFKKAGIEAKVGERIFLYGREKNWWEAGPGPAGPDAEMFYDFGTPHDPKFGPECHPNCDCGRFVEIGNDVFVQYNKTNDGKYEPLAQKSVDNGRGFERLVTVIQGKKNIYETDLFAPLLELLPNEVDIRHKRIIVDHLRGSTFLLADGVRPSNKEAGYILRRLMRRSFVYEKMYNIPTHVFDAIIHDIVHEYGEFYPELMRENENIRGEFKKEREIFSKASDMGLKELKKRYPGPQAEELIRGKSINAFIANQHVGKEAADLHQTFGLPVEIIREYLKDNFYRFDEKEFNEEVERAFRTHQEKSRAGQEKKFGGHGLLLDTGELKAANEEELKIVTRLHTATHLLNAALHKVLGDSVVQNGSDITVERTRFDFNFPRKLTSEEIKKIEDLVNYAIQKDFSVTIQTLPLEEAKKTGALFMERSKYPDLVKVYTVGDEAEIFSKELCGGPHVSHTGEIGKFKIVKEESSSAGIRRIRAVVE